MATRANELSRAIAKLRWQVVIATARKRGIRVSKRFIEHVSPDASLDSVLTEALARGKRIRQGKQNAKFESLPRRQPETGGEFPPLTRGPERSGGEQRSATIEGDVDGGMSKRKIWLKLIATAFAIGLAGYFYWRFGA